MASRKDMWQCQIHNCGYVYDPDKGDPATGIPPGTRFEDLPAGWHSRFCSATRKSFLPLEGPGSMAEKTP